ncbi:conserved hypothetical protein [Nitrosopumilaceae archaeon]|nr:hypothetical protein [Nitrosopumilus sp.]MDA7968569.1 hypothetical protein [Gammaproteobacteria bacterium]CAI9830602.1 conserved hypothetical protein [Nitrosopumilaceae archaeon]MDA7944755.1 hypothetical protein [Nitrosopumilus sp.]MDA7955104.1 hypothetical protein [Nitrosopumilus sp.]
MPGKGYATIGLKPAIVSKLQEVTDKNYPGMFLPSTLIIMMNEVKKGYYSVEPHKIRLDLSGHYTTITIRSDVRQWFAENHEGLGAEYEERYRVKCFTKFVSYFITNMIESKHSAQNHVINIKESDFEWLRREYEKQKSDPRRAPQMPGFDRFADAYINGLFGKIKEAKEILTI